MISKFTVIGLFIIMFIFNGCTKWGNKTEENLLAVQSNEIAKEWLEGKRASKMAMLNCIKYSENFKEGNK